MQSLRFVRRDTTFYGFGRTRRVSPMKNEDVLARSLDDARVLLTFDKDFGELAWRFGLPARCGIVLFRLPALGPAGAGKVIAEVLMTRDDWGRPFFSR